MGWLTCWLDFAAGLWLGLFVAWVLSLIVYRRLARIAALLRRLSEKGGHHGNA